MTGSHALDSPAAVPSSRVRLARTLVASVAGLVAVWAIVGAVGLISGSLDLGAAVDARLPWHSPVLAGLVLATVVATPMTILTVMAWRWHPDTGRFAVPTGMVLVGWIVAQWLIIRTFSWLQPLCLAAGLVIAATGFVTGRAVRPHLRHERSTLRT